MNGQDSSATKGGSANHERNEYRFPHGPADSEKRMWRAALLLSGITIFYNIGEGAVSIFFGYTDDTLSLFGFGLDSLVEVISGLGIWHMVVRIGKNDLMRDSFEKAALRITGSAFYLLAAGLLLSAAYNIYARKMPSTTFWGIVISLISIVTMGFLMAAKLRVGKSLGSDAMIADAHCTRTCLFLSIILLTASTLFEIFRIGFIDSIGAAGIAYYAYKEGKESFEKATGK